MSDETRTDNTTADLTDDEIFAKYLLDVSTDANVIDEQRDQANEDMRFVNVTGGMWEGFLTNDFDDDRVKLELDIVSDFLQRFLGEWDLNRVGVEYKPDDNKTTDDDAELLNGIYRADFRNFSGGVATDTAVLETATCGCGAFQLSTVFEDDEDPENDNMRIVWVPLHNAYNTVIWDQAAQRIDKRDARRVTKLKSFTTDSFQEVWPGKDPVSAYTPKGREFETVNTSRPQLVYVATRYERVTRKENVFVYRNLASEEIETYSEEDHALVEDELKADEFREFVRKRRITRARIEKTVFSGAEILEPTRRIVGKWLPIIPMYGYRAYVDGVEWYRGLVRKLKDAARLFNMQISQLAENASSNGQEVPIFTREQMSNPEVQAIWADKNNLAYLIVDPAVDSDGNIISSGPIGYSKPGQLDGSTAALMGLVPGFVRDVTGGAPQDTLDPDASGKAIQALIKRANMATQTVSSNISNAILWSGDVYQAMAAEIYNTPRIIGTLGRDGKDGTKQLFKNVQDTETGKIVQANTLRGKKFRPHADVGPQYETLREQTVEDLKGMLTVLTNVPGGQQYLPAIVAILLDNITGVGLDPIKELNRRIMLAQGLVKPETPEEETMVQQLQQPQEDPNQALIEAATNQQNAEARSLDAGSLDKVASAGKKEAETVKVFADIQDQEQQTGLDIKKQIDAQQDKVLELVRNLPVN